MEFRNIISPIHTERYRVLHTKHVTDGRTFHIYLEDVFEDEKRAHIYFNDALCSRFTPLKLCISEYCDRLIIHIKNNPGYMETYAGIMELIDCDELKDKSTFAKAYGYKHFIVITEDEYVEVLCKEEPIIETFTLPVIETKE